MDAALREICADSNIRNRIWDLLLRDKLRTAYKRAMDHALFLLEVEREGLPVTVDDDFEKELHRHRGNRVEEAVGPDSADVQSTIVKNTAAARSKAVTAAIDSRCNVHNEIHDVLRSYYSIALGRIVDCVCQQVVFHFLLNGKGNPLGIFCPELIMGLSDVQLAAVASEDTLVQEQRERLGREIDMLRKAVDELKFVV